MKAQADTVEIEARIHLDTVEIRNRSKSEMIEKKIKLGPFSQARSGDDAEESRILKAWYDLIEKAQIIDKKQVLQDFDNLLTAPNKFFQATKLVHLHRIYHLA